MGPRALRRLLLVALQSGFVLRVAALQATVTSHAAGRFDNGTFSQCSAEELAKKDIDLAIFAATGFTGKFASKYLAEHAEAPRWAIVGRDRSKLEALQKKVAVGAKATPTVLVADLHDYDSLLSMTRRARAVITYAGPYEMLGGEALISACIEGCAHYADVTGELPWIADMIGKYGAQAEARGVALAPFSGTAALPGDLLAISAAEAVAADGRGPPSEITNMYTKVNSGGLSGASIQSGLYSTQRHGEITDPYILAQETPQEARVDATHPVKRKMGFNEALGRDVGSYVLASSDCAVMRRSLARRFPGAAVSVAEVAAEKDMARAMASYVADPRMIVDPPMMSTKIGHSPPVWMEEKGSFALESLALRASDGAAARMRLEVAGSPGYLGTARISSELALGMALDGVSRGGFVTPALALPGGAKVLAERLVRSSYATLSEVKPALAGRGRP